MYVNRHVAGDI